MKKIFCDICGAELYQGDRTWFQEQADLVWHKLLIEPIGKYKNERSLKKINISKDICTVCARRIRAYIQEIDITVKKTEVWSDLGCCGRCQREKLHYLWSDGFYRCDSCNAKNTDPNNYVGPEEIKKAKKHQCVITEVIKELKTMK